MKKATIKTCIEQHLVEKARPGGAIVPASVWRESADRHLDSVTTIINSDPAGSLVLSWLAMHNIAKAAAASIGLQLVDESHGKVADFLACIFRADLIDEEAGLIQTIRDGRNATIYGNPAMPQRRLIGSAANLARKLRRLAVAFP